MGSALRLGGLGLAACMVGVGAPAAHTTPAGFQGACVLEGRDCGDVYASVGKATTFTKPTDIFAPAFIISGNRLRTPMALCRIKAAHPTVESNRRRLPTLLVKGVSARNRGTDDSQPPDDMAVSPPIKRSIDVSPTVPVLKFSDRRIDDGDARCRDLIDRASSG